MKNKYRLYIILLCIVGTLLPVLIDKLIIANSYFSSGLKEAWISFFGSYGGAIIGSIATILGISITIDYTNNQAKKERNFVTTQENENRRLQIAPYLKYNQCDELLKERDYTDLPCIIEDNYNTFVNTSIAIKNIGMGPVINFNIHSLKFNNENLGYTVSSNGIIEKDETIYILFDFRLNLERIKNEDLIKAPQGSFTKFNVPSKYNKGGNLELLIGYNDLLENKYEQSLIITLTTPFEADKDELEWKYCKPNLRLSRIGKPCVIKN
ncbi:hypothetical protein [Intestinibacter bartlettii]|uniref:Uncharacterized protein n=1 Tax=Intestinibacter bartlettii TaxID=261299 RepID=A0ABS6DVW4_9FIRM|nr:hypothetical protein [Intestinibacter bartlettii]MBU5335885.1 hypothetical protein [Intestinibacter bartlettii]